MSDERSLLGYFKVTACGFAIGVANVIPGVSGGTMAFILGIFEELLESIGKIASADTFKKLIRGKFGELYRTLPWKFLLALGVGIAAALATAAIAFIWLLANYQSLTYAFFFGLILSSIFVMFKDIKKWNASAFIGLAAGAAFAWWLLSMVPATTPNVWYISLGCGAIVICATILPGISGSFLLLLFGQYNYVWGAVAKFSKLEFSWPDFWTLFWTAIGAVLGLGAFVHLLNFLLRKFRNATMSTLIGFMIGSLWRLWPWQETVRWAVKTAGGKIEVAAEFISKSEYVVCEKEPLVVTNVWPQHIDLMFMLTLAILAIGAVLVLVIEIAAAKKGGKEA